MASSSRRTTQPPHSVALSDLVASLGANVDLGLSAEVGQERLHKYGPNTLPEERREPLLVQLGREFINPLTGVLAFAVGLTLYLGDLVDAAVISVVIVINALIGFLQEFRAERALRAVSQLLAPTAQVLRSGSVLSVDAASLVQGDLVLLSPGQKVPADARLVVADSLEVDESTLTGESVAVAKHPHVVSEATVLAERTNMVYAGSTVTRGTAKAIIVATGAHTELGSIGQMMRQVGRLRTPLTRRLERLASQITVAVVVIATLTLIWGMVVRELPFDFLFIAVVGLAVGAIPEGLPAVITFALASSSRRLAKQGVLIRRLPAVEALGSVTVVLTDKTGTLTKNEMTATALCTLEAEHQVSGVGYHPEGEISDLPTDRESPAWWAARVFGLCNDAALNHGRDALQLSGDPTELALLTLAHKAGLDQASLNATYPRVATTPFDSESQFMATLHTDGAQHIVAVKGSPEKVLDLCNTEVSEPERKKWMALVEHYAQSGRRVLLAALARGNGLTLDDLAALPLRPVAAVALIDPPQPEAIAALSECATAGVRVIMVTGDHPITARAIGREMGFPDTASLVGPEIDQLEDDELYQRLLGTRVIARATPAHKLRLVQLLQERGEFVAMTGDGVNDAPALRQAHIGVAMGKKGTDVAKEAADIVITDDRFATIANAIREGRRVFDNIKKSLLFLLSTDLDEAILIILAVLFGIALPVTPTQILWVNLVTSVTLSFALILERAEPTVMRRGPNPKSLSLVTRPMLTRITLASALAVLATFGLFWWELSRGAPEAQAQTAAVTMLVVIEVAILVNHRRFTASALTGRNLSANATLYTVIGVLALLQLAFVYLPAMNHVFGSRPLAIDTWVIVLGAAVLTFLIIEVEKFIRRRLFHQEVF